MIGGLVLDLHSIGEPLDGCSQLMASKIEVFYLDGGSIGE
jgi:hypothetical protein